MKLYTLSAVENLATKYENKGGQVITIKTGTLLDDYLMIGTDLKTTIVTARYLNSQSSAYTVRQYNKVPAKYQHFIDEQDELEEQEDNEIANDRRERDENRADNFINNIKE